MKAKDSDSAISVEIERHAREFDEFRALVDHSFPADQVLRWTRIAALRGLGTAHSIWGSVCWPKSLGRAIGMPLAAGLIIDCWLVQVEVEDVPDRAQKKHRLYYQGHPVSTWEITDSESYAVGFWTTQVPEKTHQIRVGLAPNVPWEQLSGSAALTLRVIDPPSQEFEAVSGTKVLPPFLITSAGLRL